MHHKTPQEGAMGTTEKGRKASSASKGKGRKRTKANTEAPIEKVPEVIVPEVVVISEEEREQERTRVMKSLFLEAYVKAMGDIKAACKLADVGRTTFYEWRHGDPQFATTLERIKIELRDDVESMAMKKIREGDGMMIRHWLDRRHPDYRPTLKQEIVTGERTFEDILYEQALKRKAIAEGKDPETVMLEAKEKEGEGEETKEETP